MAARMASMLKIKALLCLDEQGKAVDKYTMARTEVKILKSIVDKFHELGVNAKQHKIYISHADNEIFAKKAKLKNMIKKGNLLLIQKSKIIISNNLPWY